MSKSYCTYLEKVWKQVAYTTVKKWQKKLVDKNELHLQTGQSWMNEYPNTTVSFFFKIIYNRKSYRPTQHLR